MNGIFALMFFIACLIVIAMLFIALIPVFDVFVGLATHFDTPTTLLINAIVLFMLCAFLIAVFKKTNKDLNTGYFQ